MNWEVKSFDQLTPFELYEILRLRSEVFVIEQNCIYQDMDGKDQNSMHVLGYAKKGLVAYARIVKKGISYSESSIGRVVVSKSYRNQKLGNELMSETISYINKVLGEKSIRISAQSHLEKFYFDLGFRNTGKAYLEDGIPHIEMLLQN